MNGTEYGHCAKGGHTKDPDQNYVCGKHLSPEVPSLYTHCAKCGISLDEESRRYVCDACLVPR